MVASFQGEMKMKNKIIKKQLSFDLYFFGFVMFVCISVIACGFKLESNILIYLFFGILVIYTLLFSFSLVKYLFCYGDLTKNGFIDYFKNIDLFTKEYIEKKKKRDALIKKIFDWSLIGICFICAIFILIGSFFDQMVLTLVYPGWFCSLLVIFFIVMMIMKHIDHSNDFIYKLKYCFVRITNDSIYYQGNVYLINRLGFKYQDGVISFLGIKLVSIDFEALTKVEPNIEYLVSACLVGDNVKYDGGNNLREPIRALYLKGKAITICPEVMGGRTIPRKTSEKNGDIVIEEDGTDVTSQFIRGAELALEKAVLYNVEKAILKAKSPSCGVNQIYDGTFSHTLISGDGITTELLKKNGISCMTDLEYLESIKGEDNHGEES